MNDETRDLLRLQAAIDQCDAASANDPVKLSVSRTDLARLLAIADIGVLHVLRAKTNPPHEQSVKLVAKLDRAINSYVARFSECDPSLVLQMAVVEMQMIDRITAMVMESELAQGGGE